MPLLFEKSNSKQLMKNTFCIFQEVDLVFIVNRKCDFVSNSGSKYFFDEAGVYRHSNHWGRTAKSKWRLIPSSDEKKREKIGYAKWCDFHKDNDHEKLYFIEVNFVKNEVYFNHKNNLQTNNLALLRTSSETTIAIRQIRKLLESDGWTKYFNQKNIHQIIVNELITTNIGIFDIKKKYLHL